MAKKDRKTIPDIDRKLAELDVFHARLDAFGNMLQTLADTMSAERRYYEMRKKMDFLLRISGALALGEDIPEEDMQALLEMKRRRDAKRDRRSRKPVGRK